ncbi:MAG: ATP-binding protein [Burkholderiaceae bacterium]|nr:ATP-binding protein [Burkholderiaceae bacterium]
MSRDPSRSLSDALAALAQAPSRRLGPWPYLPYVATILVATLLAALIVAMVIEDRQLQREALQRDADSTAQQLSARLVLVREALALIAVEMSTGTVDARRFEALASEMIDNKPELIALAHLDPRGRPLSPPVLNFAFGPDRDPASMPEVRALAEQSASAVPHSRFALLARPPDDSAPLVLLIPAATGEPPQALLVALLSLRELLRTGLTPEMLERYRFTLQHQGRQVVASSPSVPPAGASSYATTLAALPGDLKLHVTAFRRQAVFPADALAWVAGVLALAVAAALGALALYTTRLHRIDRALLAETALRRAMENSQATGLAVLDPQGVVRYVNRALLQMTGFAADALIGRGAPFPFWLPEAESANRRALASILDGQAPPGGIEMSLRTAAGGRLDAHVYVAPLMDEDARQVGWMTSLTDVTEPRRIRTELAAAHERFVRVLESLEAAVSVVAAEGGPDRPRTLLFGNRAYAETFGPGAVGHDRLQQALRGRDSGEVRDAATDRWFDVRTREIRWPARDGGLTGDAARLQIATEITLRKMSDEIARQQQDKVQFTARLMTMGEMASSLAHELNQPLTAITNYSEGTLARLARGAMSADELEAALAKTSAQARRAGGIIRRIREFVKRSEPRRRPTPAARIVEDAIAFAEIEAAKRRISIVADVDPRLPPVDADPILIEQVLLNLLNNAIDSMQDAAVPRIDVRVRRASESTAEFAVVDRGAGIAPEHLPNVFAPFFSTKTDGMGMGLNICRSIIEFHQGQLAVERNPEPAGGTVMHFTLPLAVSQPAADEAAAPVEIPHR